MKNRKDRWMVNRPVGRVGDASAAVIAGAAGRVGGRRGGRVRDEAPAGRGGLGLETLEPRVLLGGDHPSLMFPLTPASGDPITLNGSGVGTATGTIGTTTDNDLFRFTAPANDFVRVLADTPTGSLDSWVEVYDDTGTRVALGHENGTLTAGFQSAGWVGFVATGGHNYFAVVYGENNTTGDYTLRVGALSNPTTVNPTTGLATAAGTLSTPAQDVVFKVTAGNAAIFDSLATANATADPTDLDTHLEVYDGAATQNTVTRQGSVQLASDREAGWLTNAFTPWRSHPNAVFYVRVRSDALSGPLFAGAFSLRLQMVAPELFNPVDPVTRRGSDETQALFDPYDSHMFRFMAQGTGLTIISLADFTNEGGFALHLYDNDGGLVAFNDDFVGLTPQIETQTTGGHEYFIVVDSFAAPPTPMGPPPASFGIYVESNTTFDTSPSNPTDDHINFPPNGTPADQARRQLDLATPLIFGAPYLGVDSDGNPIYDRAYRADAVGTGRIHLANDTDVFSFVPQMDQLGVYPGNNDDLGTSLFLGGAFSVADPQSLFPVASRNVAIWDAGSYWFTGRQNSPYGFADNPATPATNGAQVYSFAVVDTTVPGFRRPALFVGGDFTLVVPGAFGPVTFTNLAAWTYNPLAGKYVWASIGDVNAPVRAMTVFDPPAPMGGGPDAPPFLVVGGDFTRVNTAGGTGGTAANHIAQFDLLNGWQGLASGITGGPSPTVNALISYDPPDPGPGMPPAIPDPPDPPRSLIIGGSFTGAAGMVVNNIVRWDGSNWTPLGTALANGTNGAVRALAVFQPPDPDGPGPLMAPAPVLAVGGDFTSVAGMAANHLAEWGLVGPDPINNPMLIWQALGGGANNNVYALTVWDPPDVFGSTTPLLPVLVAGGAFTNIGAHIAQWDGVGWAPLGMGTNGTVRTLISMTDLQEPGIPSLASINSGLDPQQVLYAGGDFTMAGGGAANRVAQYAFDPNPFVFDFVWTRLRSGTNGTVFALANFDDQDPRYDNSHNFWDRNDRSASRIAIVLSPDAGSFLNTFIRVYDSNRTLIYSNDTIAPPFPDPSGALDPSLAPGTPTALVLPPTWAGETYYIVVSSATGAFRNTGRYTLTVTIDAMPPDLNNDGVPDDPTGQFTEVTNAGNYPAAVFIPTQLNIPGDGSNYVGSATPPLHGNQVRVYNPTPSGFQAVQVGDFASIERVTDTDLYYMRALSTGTVEVRINTTNIPDEFLERIFNLNDGTFSDTPRVASPGYSSKLASVIRIFNNDQVQIAFNDYNPAVTGESSTTFAGTFADRTFYHRDARVVFNVTQGEKYFIQVESAQKAVFMADPNRVDWRFATGSYELLVNSMPAFTPNFSDDHANSDIQLATPIPINSNVNDPAGGSGSITGTILDIPTNPDDADLFGFTAVATGPVAVRVTALTATLGVNVGVFDVNTALVTTGLSPVGGAVTLNFPAQQGERYFFQVIGSGGSQGDYRVDVTSAPYRDDHANVGLWINATPLSFSTFLGRATATGAIEAAGDTDVFTFTARRYDLATVLVHSMSATLNPFVRVYEVNLDGAGNQVYLQIAFNDDGGAGLGTDSRVTFSVSVGRPYYIVVQGLDPNGDFGGYSVQVDVTPTDDHPNLSDFPLATIIPINFDPVSGASIGSASGNIEVPTDDDLFRFTAPAGGFAAVTLNRTGGTLDPLLRVMTLQGGMLTDVPGSPVGDFGTTGSVILSLNVVRNVQYFILVAVDTRDDGGPMPDLGNTGTYDVQVITSPADDHPNAGEFTIASPVILSSVTGVGTGTGIILPSFDTDLFRFVSLAAGPVSINLTTPGSNLDPQITVFNSAQVVIPGATGNGDSASQTINATAAGQVFYVLVGPDNGAVGASRIGTYVLTITGTIGGGNPPGSDDHPNAGDFPHASPIALDQRTGDGLATGVINYIGDTDLFQFTTLAYGPGVTGNRPVSIQVTTPPGGLVDGAVRVFDSSFNQIGFNSNGIPGATGAFSFTAPAGATYYVLVEPVGNNTGSYAVRLATEPPTHFLYYPEGYSSTTVDEFVPLVNPNTFAVNYTIIARYEVGSRDQVIASGTIGANRRGGITVNTRNNPSGALVRTDTPYALEIQSDGQLGATFSHYDFGVTTGENFSGRLSTTWAFSEAHRDALNFRDFVLFYNPNNATANLHISLIYTDGTTVSFDRTVDALRRSGLNFTTDSALTTDGVFGVRITSDQPIIASLSSYDIARGRGFGLLGNADGGDTAGAVPTISDGNGVEASISILNTTPTTATVTVTAHYIVANLPDLTRVISVNGAVGSSAGGRLGMTLAAFGLTPGQLAGLRYTSTMPVTFTAIEYKNGDGDATATGTDGATTALFGDAFVNPATAGTTYIETLGLYNPAANSVNVTITFLFFDGTSSATTLSVDGHGFARVQIDQVVAPLLPAGRADFSIRVDAATPFVSMFTHYDLFLGGGWSTLGAPVGLTNPLSSIT